MRGDGGVLREMSGGQPRRGAEERRSRGEEKGWDEGERCLETGSGVRDWKTEGARSLHSNQRQLRCVWHWTTHYRQYLFVCDSNLQPNYQAGPRQRDRSYKVRMWFYRNIPWMKDHCVSSETYPVYPTQYSAQSDFVALCYYLLFLQCSQKDLLAVTSGLVILEFIC